jgi:hypothetical protein
MRGSWTRGSGISRRRFLKTGSVAAAAVAGYGFRSRRAWGEPRLAAPLGEFGYGDVQMASELHEAQRENTHAVLMALNEDSLLKPFRQMSGLPAPGEDLGGWYSYNPDYDYRKHFDDGFAPGCHFGQWVSALARNYAITGDEATREKVLRLNRLYAQTITPQFYVKSRFPAYTYDKRTRTTRRRWQSWSRRPTRRCHISLVTRSNTTIPGGRTKTPAISHGTGMNPTQYPKTCSWPTSAARAGATTIWDCNISTTRRGSIRWHGTRMF